MKLFLQYADAAGNTDGVTESQILKHLPLTKNLGEADAVVVMCVCHAQYAFNHGLNDVLGKKPIVMLNFLEYGWNFDFKREVILGRGAAYPCTSDNHDWGTLDQWTAKAQPVLTFQRECKRSDLSSTVVPIDFAAEQPIPRTATEEEFNARLLDVSYVWGYSHPDRARMHGEIYCAMGDKGISVISDFSSLGSKYVRKKTWFTRYAPHWDRTPMTQVMEMQRQSKIAISLKGCGRKCFRQSEAPVGAVMAMHHDELAYSYDWLNGVNCIKLTRGREFVELIAACERPDLYAIYVNGQENIRHYVPATYAREYILKQIAKVL